MWWLSVMRVGVWLVPLRLLRRVSRRTAQSSGGVSVTRPPRQRIVWAVTAASRVVPRATCLPQALATQTLLARRGYPAQLRIGVAKSDAGLLEAHAWVESDGQVVVGNVRNLARYSRLPPLPGESA